MEKSIETRADLSPAEIEERDELARGLAETAGLSTNTYETIDTVTIFNPSSDGKESEYAIGDFISGKKTDNGWVNEIVESPIRGIIIKVRMFLKTKWKYAQKQNCITDEFDNYVNDVITVKEKTEDGKYTPIFVGTYKQVNEKFSLKDDTEIEKKLDLHHAIYVLTDIKNPTVVRIDSKGVSRTSFFEFMNSFTRRSGDFMPAWYSLIDSKISTKDRNGKTRKTPIAGFIFEKDCMLTVAEMKIVKEIQIKFEEALKVRDEMFAGKKAEPGEGEQSEPQGNDGDQGKPEELPTINLEEDKFELPEPLEDKQQDISNYDDEEIEMSKL